MNYIKAQKDVFNELCKGSRTGKFHVDAHHTFVTPNGCMGYIIPDTVINFSLDKITDIHPFAIVEVINAENELTLMPDLRIIDRHRIARRLRGNGKNVFVNVKFLSCFQNPKFYQEANPLSGIVVTETVCRRGGEVEQLPVGYLLPIRADSLQGDYYNYADTLEGDVEYAEAN